MTRRSAATVAGNYNERSPGLKTVPIIYKFTDTRRTRPCDVKKGGNVLGTPNAAVTEALEKLAGKSVGDAIDLTLGETYALWKPRSFPGLRQDARLAYSHFLAGKKCRASAQRTSKRSSMPTCRRTAPAPPRATGWGSPLRGA